YRLLQKLGEGGMGAVYLAEHTLLGRRAAVKVLLPRHSSDQAVVNRFFNEAKATTKIKHPSFVQVFDFGYHTDGSAFLVMEFLEGESLASRIARDRALSPELIINFTRQIAAAVGIAHEHGIIHRDLKPDNVFLVAEPELPGGIRIKI